MIQLEGRKLCKSFGQLRVLRGVDLQVSRGEVVTLIGPSGSGKSTLLRCLNLLEIPDSGELLWEEQSVQYGLAPEKTLSAHRARVGMVFQHFGLFPHRTALQNVMEGPLSVLGVPDDEARARAARLLARVGLADKESVYPAQLSGGQKQRVAIARSLAMEPAALLLDEVTSALDVEMVAGINELLGELAQSMTMVAVTHDLSFAARVSSRVAFMDGGQLLESGPPEQVLRDPSTERAAEFLKALA